MERIEGGRPGMGLCDPLLRGAGRRQVRLDRLRPHAEAREDVRWHVQRVRRGRRDLRVGARRGQRQLRELGIVERVDHVVRDARMVGFEREQPVEDLRRLLLARIGLVRRIRGCQQSEGMKACDLQVFRKLLMGRRPGLRERV